MVTPDDVPKKIDPYHSRPVVDIDSMALNLDCLRKGNLVISMQTRASGVFGHTPDGGMACIAFASGSYLCKELMAASLQERRVVPEYRAIRTGMSQLVRANAGAAGIAD